MKFTVQKSKVRAFDFGRYVLHGNEFLNEKVLKLIKRDLSSIHKRDNIINRCIPHF